MSQTVAVGPGHHETGKTVGVGKAKGQEEEFRASKRLFFSTLGDAAGSEAEFLC